MKYPVVVSSLILLFIFSQPSRAQELSDTSNAKTSVFQNFSLQFQVRLLELKSFQGSIISFKYHFNDHFALRAGVGLSMRNSNSEMERDVFHTDTILTRFKVDENYYSFSLPVQFLYYFNPKKDIKFFVGLGPYFTYVSNKRIETDLSDPNNIYSTNLRNNESKDYFIGLSSVYGVEWFITDDISLTAEYGFRFGYNFGEGTSSTIRKYPDQEIYIEKRKTKGEGWQFTANIVLFGLSIYF